MRLVPTQSPGRSTRKARAFESEIVRLRVEGYSLEAIREALADAGVDVSTSTVSREARRSARPRTAEVVPAAVAQGTPSPSNPRDPSNERASPTPTASQVAFRHRSGAELVDEFMRDQITNSLIRAKEQP